MAERHAVPEATLHAQATASDPDLSAWVMANAGSGKTFVLARRVIRLMLADVPPEKILCLTFTKAAAAQMSNRVFEILAKWTRLPEPQLAEALTEMTGRMPGQAEIRNARTLFARSLDTPGGLKIQTIHAFCESLLHRFPLEADLPGHFEVIEETRQKELLAQARNRLFRRFAIDHSPEGDRLRQAHETLIGLATDTAIETALDTIIAQRNAVGHWIDRKADAMIDAMLRDGGFPPDTDTEKLARQLNAESAIASAPFREICDRAAALGGPTNLAFCQFVSQYQAADSEPTKLELRTGCFLTANGTRRKTIVTRDVIADRPDLAEAIDREKRKAEQALQCMANFKVLTGSRAIFRLGRAILADYAAMKRDAGLADFDDLISSAATLLGRSEIRDWVLFKLDRGIDHVLIDEAQDTSPSQWAIVNAIIAEFFAGEGAGGSKRTVFAVGDEKQSIYSFQGADPVEFARQADLLEKRTGAAGQRFENVRLPLSFRSTPEILDAVDRVFAVEDHRRGLGRDANGTVHEAIRTSRGRVEIWPIHERVETEEITSWLAPVDSVDGADPAFALARQIAGNLRHWLREGIWLSQKERYLEPGDVLILVRKRDRFVNAMLRELRAAGIDVAGADRLILNEHIAAQDLIALGKFACQPSDDLSLAGVLKSPVLDKDDEFLIALTADRGNRSLAEQISHLASCPHHPLHETARKLEGRICGWARNARLVGPFEFYSEILGAEGARSSFIARLGHEVDEILDAFLQSALEYEQGGATLLDGFLDRLENHPPQIKREVDMLRNEVRVITAHSAKGLEAPFVFLVDPCTQAYEGRYRPVISEIRTSEDAPAFLWRPHAGLSVATTQDAEAVARNAAEEEYRRLLYVAMTRAGDRLVVCGWRGARTSNFPHWHSMVSSALAGGLTEEKDVSGESVSIWRGNRRRGGEAALGQAAAEPAETAVELPAWLRAAARPEPEIAGSVTPSAAKEFRPLRPLSSSTDMQDTAGIANAREQGIATHQLLQMLPDIDAETRDATLSGFLERQYPRWPTTLREELQAQAIAVFTMPQLRFLFGEGTRAEAPVAGWVTFAGRSHWVNGKIDRLRIAGDRGVIADFKTDRHIPEHASEIPHQYLRQMALYRELARKVFPGVDLEYLLVWTRGPVAMPLPGQLLESSLGAETEQAAG